MASRAKMAGNYSERKIVDHMPEKWAATRVDERAGQLGKAESCDIVATIAGGTRRIEVKRVTGGFVRLRKWLRPVDIVAIDEPRGDPLVVMTLEKFIELVSRNDD
tara:strand:+ start:3917 stop:4231 length:315 start_codon:yes stop_codon:yes gene_type:complete